VTDQASRHHGGKDSPNPGTNTKGTTTMIDQMINEARDSIIYGYATGWAHLHAVAYRVSVLACEGRLTDADRDRIHDHLRQVFGGLDRLYGQAAISLPAQASRTNSGAGNMHNQPPRYSIPDHEHNMIDPFPLNHHRRGLPRLLADTLPRRWARTIGVATTRSAYEDHIVQLARLDLDGDRDDLATYVRRTARKLRTTSPHTAEALGALVREVPDDRSPLRTGDPTVPNSPRSCNGRLQSRAVPDVGRRQMPRQRR
jgi:hypothetical protein